MRLTIKKTELLEKEVWKKTHHFYQTRFTEKRNKFKTAEVTRGFIATSKNAKAR